MDKFVRDFREKISSHNCKNSQNLVSLLTGNKIMCTYCINSRRVALQFTKTTLPVITWKRFLNYVQYNQANEDAICAL